jgi:hypothetical protein
MVLCCDVPIGAAMTFAVKPRGRNWTSRVPKLYLLVAAVLPVASGENYGSDRPSQTFGPEPIRFRLDVHPCLDAVRFERTDPSEVSSRSQSVLVARTNSMRL